MSAKGTESRPPAVTRELPESAQLGRSRPRSAMSASRNPGHVWAAAGDTTQRLSGGLGRSTEGHGCRPPGPPAARSFPTAGRTGQIGQPTTRPALRSLQEASAGPVDRRTPTQSSGWSGFGEPRRQLETTFIRSGAKFTAAQGLPQINSLRGRLWLVCNSIARLSDASCGALQNRYCLGTSTVKSTALAMA